VIKLNVDAAIKALTATIAVVARNSAGSIIHFWSKNLLTDDPCIAEATAILWALEIAQTEEFLHIIVEGDAKICLDAIMEELSSCPWRIRSLISNIKCLALNFVFCRFCWVGRCANELAHSLAKFVSTCPISLRCNPSYLPPSVREAWIRD
jgi:ribonuclease HI